MNISPPETMRMRMDRRGFTLIELLVVVVIISALSAIAYPAYIISVNRVKYTRASADIHTIDKAVSAYSIDNYALPNGLPDLLTNAGMTTAIDPWGRNYEYLKIELAPANARMHGVIQMNLDFDLYSRGPDGLTHRTLSQPVCADDIVRYTNRPDAYVGPVVPDIIPP
jgi:general secretion pathway protein G